MKVTIEHEGTTASIEAPATEITDVIEVIAGALVAVGFSEKTVIEGLERYAEENKSFL